MEAIAKLRHLRASAQKVRLVADLIRGQSVEDALRILRHTRKGCSKDLEMLVRSAVANAEVKDPSVDVDELVVSKIWVDGGPMQKGLYHAPMGRGFRILKRRSHITVVVGDRPVDSSKGKKGKAVKG